MKIELYFTVMAGVVLGLSLIVGEIAALRGFGMKLFLRLKRMLGAGRRSRAYIEIGLIAFFFVVQPFIVGYFVMGVLDNFNPHFAANTVQELRASIAEIFG